MAARSLPLFPLPVVLFPTATLPLHIFEPRYRTLLADELAGDRRFGLLYRPESIAERELPAGQIGCIARIEHAEPLPDGRSNIVVSGEERFALVRFVDAPHPYHVGEVEPWTDNPEPPGALDTVADTVRALFARVVRAARAIADDPAPLPDLPDDPALLAFRIAAVIDTPVAVRYALLRSRSPLARLNEMRQLLESALDPIERRADTHRRARQNGRGHDAAADAAP